ncbi:MAG: hypothetical protein FWE06_00440 [Oscillospiraceae bacterium]|nr:hypothetical protein [Oscillospiraceae bacterium]
MQTRFLCGVSVGVVAGAALAAAILPIDKRTLRKSPPARALKSMGKIIDHVT